MVKTQKCWLLVGGRIECKPQSHMSDTLYPQSSVLTTTTSLPRTLSSPEELQQWSFVHMPKMIYCSSGKYDCFLSEAKLDFSVENKILFASSSPTQNTSIFLFHLSKYLSDARSFLPFYQCKNFIYSILMPILDDALSQFLHGFFLSLIFSNTAQMSNYLCIDGTIIKCANSSVVKPVSARTSLWTFLFNAISVSVYSVWICCHFGNKQLVRVLLTSHTQTHTYTWGPGSIDLLCCSGPVCNSAPWCLLVGTLSQRRC